MIGRPVSFVIRHYFEKEFPELEVILKMPSPVLLGKKHVTER